MFVVVKNTKKNHNPSKLRQKNFKLCSIRYLSYIYASIRKGVDSLIMFLSGNWKAKSIWVHTKAIEKMLQNLDYPPENRTWLNNYLSLRILDRLIIVGISWECSLYTHIADVHKNKWILSYYCTVTCINMYGFEKLIYVSNFKNK